MGFCKLRFEYTVGKEIGGVTYTCVSQADKACHPNKFFLIPSKSYAFYIRVRDSKMLKK